MITKNCVVFVHVLFSLITNSQILTEQNRFKNLHFDWNFVPNSMSVTQA